MKQLFFILIFSCLLFAESSLLEVGTQAESFTSLSIDGKRDYLRVWCGEKLMKPRVNDIKHRVILSFWSVNCAPCMKEIPELHRFAKNYTDGPLKVFLINVDKISQQKLKEFVDEKGWVLPVLRDNYQIVAEKYGVVAQKYAPARVPATYVLSPEGVIEHVIKGIPEETSTDKYLEMLLSQGAEGAEKASEEDVVVKEIEKK